MGEKRVGRFDASRAITAKTTFWTKQTPTGSGAFSCLAQEESPNGKIGSPILEPLGQNLFISPRSHVGNQTWTVRVGAGGGQTGLCVHLRGDKDGIALNI